MDKFGKVAALVGCGIVVWLLVWLTILAGLILGVVRLAGQVL